ncbi:unnamed protein product, partial [Allacma fusca]
GKSTMIRNILMQAKPWK